jgi:hypothetical protein
MTSQPQQPEPTVDELRKINETLNHELKECTKKRDEYNHEAKVVSEERDKLNHELVDMTKKNIRKRIIFTTTTKHGYHPAISILLSLTLRR